jgi:hypothetical protein
MGQQFHVGFFYSKAGVSEFSFRFGAQFGFDFQDIADGVLDIREGFIAGRALRAAARQGIANNGPAVFTLDERDTVCAHIEKLTESRRRRRRGDGVPNSAARGTLSPVGFSRVGGWLAGRSRSGLDKMEPGHFVGVTVEANDYFRPASCDPVAVESNSWQLRTAVLGAEPFQEMAENPKVGRVDQVVE